MQEKHLDVIMLSAAAIHSGLFPVSFHSQEGGCSLKHSNACEQTKTVNRRSLD